MHEPEDLEINTSDLSIYCVTKSDAVATVNALQVLSVAVTVSVCVMMELCVIFFISVASIKM